jgi:adenosylmethionine-8-amino-7-oxononanoate aminotransferase
MGDTLILAPPFNATESELSELVDKFTGALAAGLRKQN